MHASACQCKPLQASANQCMPVHAIDSAHRHCLRALVSAIGRELFDVPDLPELEALVLELRRRLMSGEVIYIHCRGGHGRTGTVAVPLVASLFDSTVEAVEAYINRVTVESRASDKRAAARGIPIELPETDEQRAMAGRASERVRLVLSEGTARHRVRVQS